MFSAIYQRTKDFTKFLKPKKKFLAFFCLSFLLINIFIFSAAPALATDPGKEDAASNQAAANGVEPGMIVGAVTSMMLFVAKVFLQVAMFALSFIIQIAGYNGYLESTAVNVGWVMVRDVTNMFFVVILLLVAFGTILGLEQYEWKKMLVKFFFAAVLVNFSRIICGLMIDVGQVIMITFVNGIAATAGGNLISAFSLTDIFAMSNKADSAALTSGGEIFGAALGAVVFSALTMAIMLVFVYMLLARLIVLWILIILSPFAFVLSVIPQTEKYASQWWSEFGNHVVVGPAVVFFLWLSFAVVGSGNVDSEIKAGSQLPDAQKDLTPAQAPVSAAMDPNHMANFAIAIGILLVGAKTAQSLGTVGGDSMSKATDFAKKTAMVASGAAAGLWAANKGKDLAVAGATVAGVGLAKGVYMGTGMDDRVHKIANWTKRNTVEAWKNWRSEGQQQIQYEKNADGSLKVDPKTGGHVAARDENGDIMYEKDERTGIAAGMQRFFYNRKASVIRSDRMLKKVQDETETNEELISKRARAVPDHVLQNFGITSGKDQDRRKKGILAAENERSEAKTSEFEAEGRELVLKNKRFAYNPQTGKEEEVGEDTVAQQIEGHKARADRTNSQIKDLFAQAKRAYLTGKGKQVLAAKVAADFKAEVNESAAHLAEGGQKLEFLGTGEGQKQLMELTGLKEKEKEEHKMIEGEEALARKEFFKDPHNRHLLEAVSQADQSKKASDAFVTNLESEVMSEAFSEAKDKIEKVIEKWKAGGSGDISKLDAMMSQASEDDFYVDALRQAALSKEKTKDAKYNETKAADFAANAVVNIARFREIPSDATDALTEEEIKEYSGQERADASKTAADTMFGLIHRAQNGEKLSEADRSAIMGSWGKVDSEAWNDDFSDYFVRMVTQFKENPNSLTGQKRVIAEQMAKAADASGGIEAEMVDGKYKLKSGYSRRMSAMMQSMAATGGDMQAWQAHDAVSQRQKELMQTDEGKAEWKSKGYWGVAADLAAENKLGGYGSVEEMQGGLRGHQDRLKYAAKHFKQNGIDNGHWESVLNQEYDDGVGLYRMNTEMDAESGSVTEISKRTLSQQLGFQVHSAGELDLTRGLMKGISEKMFAALTSSLNESFELRNMSSRSLAKLLGYHESEKIEVGQLGGDRMLQQFKDENGADADGSFSTAEAKMEEHMIRDFLVKGLNGNAKAMSLMLQRAFNTSDKDAAAGNFNFKFKHLAGGAAVTNVQDLVHAIEMTDDKLGVSEADLENLRKVARSFSEGKVLSDRKGGGTPQSAQ